MSSKERIRAGSNVFISTLGALAILLAINYLAMRHYVRSDWTSAGSLRSRKETSRSETARE